MDNKLKKLIKQSIEKGIPLETFRKTLEEFNWDSYSIEQASREFEIRKFIFDARKNNISDKKIRENLRKHNWTDREISKAMDKIYIPKPSKELLIKNFIILIALIALILIGMQLLNLTKNSLIRINHYNSLDNEFNKTLYDTNIKSYSQVISKSCGSKKSFIVGKIITDEDISDINISSNIGSLNVNSLNSSGEFILEINCEGNVILNFEKENFVPLHKKINLLEGTNFLDVYLIRENEFIQVEDSLEIENIKMNFEDNSFGEKDALISLTPFSSNNIEDSYYFPGDLNGLDINGNQVYLESYGFFKIKAKDSSKIK